MNQGLKESPLREEAARQRNQFPGARNKRHLSSSRGYPELQWALIAEEGSGPLHQSLARLRRRSPIQRSNRPNYQANHRRTRRHRIRQIRSSLQSFGCSAARSAHNFDDSAAHSVHNSDDSAAHSAHSSDGPAPRSAHSSDGSAPGCWRLTGRRSCAE